MLRGTDVALYFLNLDEDHTLFTKQVIVKNGRHFYDGNARLNKYLHIAQNIYIAKYGKPLVDSIFYAYDNGAVDLKVQENFSILFEMRGKKDVVIPETEKDFLTRIYIAFQNATLDELIDLSHEDPEWESKHSFYNKKDQKMDSLSRKDEYSVQYADIINVLDRMKV